MEKICSLFLKLWLKQPPALKVQDGNTWKSGWIRDPAGAGCDKQGNPAFSLEIQIHTQDKEE